ncbi:uncharacterized protein TNIN_13871 [Trichonephila inaurata madagascariensis]|uniref:Uncharacterized protein n=1 Tax=Trichonephila inaurata madagascariensis TaxID=2747483 RepID=A0A8X6WU41_9ARAC|nr:uncharacterized protein TNIN_13871 [Trichonephila inaurata madagascariensis]
MYSQKKNLQILIHFIKSHSDVLKVKQYGLNSRVIDTVLSVIFTFPVLLAGIYAYFEYRESKINRFWTFGHTTQDPKHRILLDNVFLYIYFTVYLEYPCLIAFSLFILIRNYGTFLLRIRENIKITSPITTTEQYVKILSDYNSVEKKIRLLKGTLSIPLLLILSVCFCIQYTALSFGVHGRPSLQHILVTCSNVCTGIVILFSLTLISDRIPECISQIKTAAGFLIDNCNHHSLNELEKIVLLKKFKKKETIYLTAGGVVYLRKSFILSAFGAIFTYGLLVLNLK